MKKGTIDDKLTETALQIDSALKLASGIDRKRILMQVFDRFGPVVTAIQALPDDEAEPFRERTQKIVEFFMQEFGTTEVAEVTPLRKALSLQAVLVQLSEQLGEALDKLTPEQLAEYKATVGE